MGDSNVFADLWNGLGAAISSIDLGHAITEATLAVSPSKHGATPPPAAPPVDKVHGDVVVLKV